MVQSAPTTINSRSYLLSPLAEANSGREVFRSFQLPSCCIEGRACGQERASLLYAQLPLNWNLQAMKNDDATYISVSR